MKTTSFIALPLLIAGLLLNGCSGLDDPDDPNPPPPTDGHDGTYELNIFPPSEDEGACTRANGIMKIIDGKVTGQVTDQNTGEQIDLSGGVESDGFIEGALKFSTDTNAGTYNGLMKISTGKGTWEDIHDCAGEWLAIKN